MNEGRTVFDAQSFNKSNEATAETMSDMSTMNSNMSSDTQSAASGSDTASFVGGAAGKAIGDMIEGTINSHFNAALQDLEKLKGNREEIAKNLGTTTEDVADEYQQASKKDYYNV